MPVPRDRSNRLNKRYFFHRGWRSTDRRAEILAARTPAFNGVRRNGRRPEPGTGRPGANPGEGLPRNRTAGRRYVHIQSIHIGNPKTVIENGHVQLIDGRRLGYVGYGDLEGVPVQVSWRLAWRLPRCRPIELGGEGHHCLSLNPMGEILEGLVAAAQRI